MKLIAVASLLLAVVSCSAPCHDLIQHEYLLGVHTVDNYYECMKGCCKQPPKTPRDCSCSDRCPCWSRHSPDVKIVIPADQMPKAQ